MSALQHQLLSVLPQSLQYVDYTGINWEQVQRAQYWIYQKYSYEYPGPIFDLHQKLTVVPPQRHGGQYLTGHKLRISADEVSIRSDKDEHGNSLYYLDLPRVDGRVQFEVWNSIEKVTASRGFITPQPLINPQLAELYLQPTPLTQPAENLEAVAREIAAGVPSGDAWQLADQISEWVWQKMVYKHGVTNVATTASEALEIGEGLCQDYSHIMIALCRILGLPARYVSGTLLGEGGSHAWVEVLLPQQRSRTKNLVAVAFDPTNRCRAGMRHLTVAVGRDYRDVSPTSGYFTAPYSGVLKTSKQAGVVAVQFRDGSELSIDIDAEDFDQLEDVA